MSVRIQSPFGSTGGYWWSIAHRRLEIAPALAKLGLLALLASGACAHAQSTIAQYQMRADSVFSAVTVNNPTGVVSDSASDATATTSASLYASYGTLRNLAEASASQNQSDSVAVVSMSATFTDIVNITSNGMAGQTGYALFDIDYHWLLNATGSASGSWGSAQSGVTASFGGSGAYVQEILQVAQTTTHIYYGAKPLGGGVVMSDFDNASFSVLVPFQFGRDTPLSMILSSVAQANSNASGSGSGSVDAFHSAYWGGISSVTNAAGDLVSFAVTSASGADYTQSFSPIAAVPEPSTHALLLAGLGGLAWLQRRHRSQALRTAKGAAEPKSCPWSSRRGRALSARYPNPSSNNA